MFKLADKIIDVMHMLCSTGFCRSPIIRQVTLFTKGFLKAISKLNIDLPNDGSTTVFGERRVEHPGRKYIFGPGFQTGQWSRGAVPYPPHADVTQLLEQYFATAPDSELSGNFLVHEVPMFIKITGYMISDQLVGGNMIQHELVSLLFRRFAQLDFDAEYECPYLSWRHPIEPEFLTLGLWDSDFIHTLSIQKQFTVYYSGATPKGWMVIIWDVVTKKKSLRHIY